MMTHMLDDEEPKRSSTKFIIEKIAEARTNEGEKKVRRRRRPQSPEHREAISRGMRGRTLSPEHRVAISRAHKGRPLSPEHRVAISRAHKGRPLSPEHRAALSRRVKKP